MNQQTLLYRQVHPSWVLEDGVSSLCFRPSPKDNKKLSVYDGDKYTADESFNHYTSDGHSSSGTLAVTNQECDAENLPRTSDDDTFDGHVLVEFTGCLTKGEIERKAKNLRDAALRRGWQYQKPPEEASEEADESAQF